MLFLRICNYILMFFVLTSVHCGPHSHKIVSNKETINDGLFVSRDSKHFTEGEHNREFDHESVLGSHSAAEEFDQLSPEESKKRLKLLALKMDKDQDGYVSKKELTEWVLQSFAMLTEEEALDQLEDEDGDGDSKVTWEEHVAETYGVFDDDLSRSEEISPEEYKMKQNDRELFDAADTNKDGILDKSEFPAFSHPEEFTHMYTVVYEQAMKKRDRNQDGYLSFEEFISDIFHSRPNPNAEHFIAEKDHFINDYDQDKDGKLSKEEVLLWLIPNNVEMAESEADHLIESSDEDHDGRLSIAEIVDHHEIFVGSEATDFGEHLQDTNKFKDEL